MANKKIGDGQLKKILALFNEHGTSAKACFYADMPVETFKYQLRKARERLVYNVPEGQTLKGTSTLYKIDKDGNKTATIEWVKTNKDLDRQREIIAEVVEAMKGSIPKELKVNSPEHTGNDLLSAYIITDYHIGCLSWEGETGETWNVQLAEDTLVNWFGEAIKSSPNSHTGVLAQLGDFLHYDSLEAITPTSGHVLDADTRYQHVVQVAIRAVRRIIRMMLEKHQEVVIIMAEGNHDISSSVWLRALFSTLYEDEPRVTVDNTHIPYYAIEWGKTSLFFHHGHKAKMATISSSMAGMYREIFGRTTYSYAHMGHLHHRDVKENSMMIVEQHPTLAAKDAYSARGGYISQRGASVITYSKLFGEVARATIRPEMFINKEKEDVQTRKKIKRKP